jgi:hypothetical protein
MNNYVSRIVEDAGFESPKSLLFVYKPDICSTCSSGTFLYSINQDIGMAIIFPAELSDADVFNMRKIFSLNGPYIKGNELSAKLIRKIQLCSKLSNGDNIYYIYLKQNGRIKAIKYVY